MLSTDKQTNKQTDRQTNQRDQKHNLLCQGGNKLTNATKNITSFAKEVINDGFSKLFFFCFFLS